MTGPLASNTCLGSISYKALAPVTNLVTPFRPVTKFDHASLATRNANYKGMSPLALYNIIKEGDMGKLVGDSFLTLYWGPGRLTGHG